MTFEAAGTRNVTRVVYGTLFNNPNPHPNHRGKIQRGVRWRGGVKWEWGRRKWRFSVHSVTVFRTIYIYGHTTAFRWYNCQWPLAYFKVIGLFHIKFLKNGVWYGKSYYRQLIGNNTLAFDWCHFWWPWSTFWRSFNLGCHFHVHFSYPWHAFASHGLPAIAELLVRPSRACAGEYKETWSFSNNAYDPNWHKISHVSSICES